MQRLIAGYKDLTELKDGGEIPALHGARALMVLFVASFHFWQHSWLTPSLSLFGRQISMDPLLRTGYLWVDGLLLLSGFLCYLPHAAAAMSGRPSPPALPFFRRRFLRIFPSYLFNLVVVLLFVALPGRAYPGPWEAARDMLAHLTFTHNLFRFSYLATPLNGVLWTLAVEAQFYLIFPLLARAFRKMPLLTYAGMLGAAVAFRAYAGAQGDNSMLINQLPAFLDVYANGFVAASVFTALRRRMKEDGWTRVLMTVCAVAALMALSRLLLGQAGESGLDMIRAGQLSRRFLFSALLALLLIGVSLGLGGVRLLLGNPLTRFLSAISYQFYIWHQLLATWLRQRRIPMSISPEPNRVGEDSWQWRYLALCFAGTLLIATLCTYLIERPLARRRGPKGTKKTKEAST